MGSSESGGGIDAGAGPIVWVRRRNGSWWPGKILSPDELAECNLTSPRAGTPVKLLGRDDASVDWYNLEKSKRVKPFRCGDFDECIEKAESAHGLPIKKREKYARREDAILHAIELERQLLGKKAFVDDHFGEMPQMRDLKDFGLITTIRKRKFSPSLDLDSRKSSPENLFPVNSVLSTDRTDDALSTYRADNSNGVEQTRTLLCTKRSDLVYPPADFGDLMDNKAHPSGQGNMFSIDAYRSQFDENDGHHHHGLLNEQKSSSDFMQDIRHDSSGSDSSESDSSATDPKMKHAMTVYSGGSQPLEPRFGPLGGSQPPGEEETTSSEETDDSVFSGRMHPHYLDDHYPANEAESIWQWRGKQDAHHLMTKPLERGKEKFAQPCRTKGSTVGSYRVINGDDDSDADDDDNDDHDEFDTRYVGFPNSLRHVSRSRPNTTGPKVTRWEDITWEDRPACFKVRGQHFTPAFVSQQPFGGRPSFMLVDVDLKVQASYPKGTVPIISLRSKASGRAVIGHPIKVEPLEYGSTDALVASTSDHCSSETTVEHDRGAVLKPSWRTARRTNSRVPRPRLIDDLPFISQHGRVAFKKSGQGARNGGQLARKAGKKASMSLNQKTRMLSSIGVQQGFSKAHAVNHHSSGSSSSSSQMEGVMKGETSGLTTVACIPVKLVFSRLLEKINRPPSKPAAVSSKVAAPVAAESSSGRVDIEGQVQQEQEQY